MQSRFAIYFRRLADTSSHVNPQNIVKHKAELDRIYHIIQKSAKDGGKCVYIPHADSFWNNHSVQNELHKQGFRTNHAHSSQQGSVEWSHAMSGGQNAFYGIVNACSLIVVIWTVLSFIDDRDRKREWRKKWQT